jgi:hypothetical protein
MSASCAENPGNVALAKWRFLVRDSRRAGCFVNLTRPPMPSAPRFVLVTSSRPNKGAEHWLQMTWRREIITSNRRDSSKVKLLNALTLIILLSTQLAIGSQTVTNDEKVANYLTDSFYNLGRAQTTTTNWIKKKKGLLNGIILLVPPTNITKGDPTWILPQKSLNYQH